MDETKTPTTPQSGPQSGWSGWSRPSDQYDPQYDQWTTRVDDARPASPHPQPVASQPRRGTAFLVTLALGAGVLGGVAGAGVVTVLDDDQPAAQSSPPVQNSLDGSSADSDQPASSFSSVEEVAAQVLPSVVSIAVQSQAGSGTGTGVVISSDGQILTNNHVVESGGQLTVTFHDGTTAEAEVVGTDPVTDLAVIQVADASGLTAAELGSSGDLEVGQQVVAIGSPFGLEGTVTSGIVSAVGRPVTPGSQDSLAVIDAIQTDAPINPGNSGGPLVNMAGQVVGINSAIFSPTGSGSVGLGFAIPIDQAKPIAEELIDTGQATHARIGISVGAASGETRGAQVASVEPGSGADEARLAEGDVITKIDDRLVTDGTSLVAAARSFRPGDTVTLTIVRGGETQTVEVTLGSDADAG
ncbi:MAG TPA: trypsin-like peptidase domain-containing protein [Jiangellaceae bacterium]|nr:trypsin-like peptidase domain-containing protein [Jiangellaceae bacterium]